MALVLFGATPAAQTWMGLGENAWCLQSARRRQAAQARTPNCMLSMRWRAFPGLPFLSGRRRKAADLRAPSSDAACAPRQTSTHHQGSEHNTNSHCTPVTPCTKEDQVCSENLTWTPTVTLTATSD